MLFFVSAVMIYYIESVTGWMRQKHFHFVYHDSAYTEDVCNSGNGKKNLSPEYRLHVSFIGETANDTGALRKEFLTGTTLISNLYLVSLFITEFLNKGS